MSPNGQQSVSLCTSHPFSSQSFSLCLTLFTTRGQVLVAHAFTCICIYRALPSALRSLPQRHDPPLSLSLFTPPWIRWTWAWPTTSTTSRTLLSSSPDPSPACKITFRAHRRTLCCFLLSPRLRASQLVLGLCLERSVVGLLNQDGLAKRR